MKIKLVLISVSFCLMAQVIPGNAAQRILFVDSYHEGNELSDGVTAGIQSTLQGKNITLKIHHMDTKRNSSIGYKKNAAIQAKKIIADFKPDVVIASEDNASKYLIVPYYKDSNIPFVFCGVNFSADAYGFPFSNVTGIVDVPPILKLIYSLKHFKRVLTVGYLAADTLTQRKDGEFMKQEVREEFVESYVDNFEDWKKEFRLFQGKVDVLVLGNNSGIKKWNDSEAINFTMNNTQIPTGCLLDWLTPFVFLGATRQAQEQGSYAASIALKIIEGAPVSSFPIVRNKEVNIVINKKIAGVLGLKIPNSFFKVASKVIE